MKKTLALVTFAWLPLGAALAGCDPETNRLDVVVQHDGSATVHVVHETSGLDIIEERDPGTRAPREASRFMAGWRGVDSWTDVTATPIERGRTRVEATAWLPSLRDLRVNGQRRFDVSLEGDALEVRFLDPLRSSVRELFLQDRRKVQAALTQPEPEFEVSVDELRSTLELLLAPWTFDLALRLPGPLEQVDGFAQEPTGRVVLRQDVLTVLELVERHLGAMRDVRARVAAGALTPAQGYEQLVRLADEADAARPQRVRCRLPSDLPAPAFDARR